MKKLLGPDKWAEKRKLKGEKFLPKEEAIFKCQETVRSLGYTKEVTVLRMKADGMILEKLPLEKSPVSDKWAEKRKLKAENKDKKTLLKYREIIRSWGYTGEVTDIKISAPDTTVNRYRDIPLLLFLHEWSFATCHAQLSAAYIRNTSPVGQERIKLLIEHTSYWD